VGTGPLYRGQPFPGLTSVPGRAAEWSLAFDAAICAAGYNTYGELMFAGVPTAFLPQHKLADDQEGRAQLAVERGAGVLLERGWDGERIHRAVVDLIERPGAREAARALVPENCARVAAAELLRLVCARARVDLAEATLDDARLERLHAPPAREQEAMSLGHRLCRGVEQQLGVAIDRSSLMLARRDANEGREVRGVVDAIVRGLPSSSVEARAHVCDVVLGALGALRAGDGAAARATVADGRWGAAVVEDGMTLARQIRATL